MEWTWTFRLTTMRRQAVHIWIEKSVLVCKCAVDKTSTTYNYRINHIVSHFQQWHTRKCVYFFVFAILCNSSNSVHCTGILVCNYRMIALILVSFRVIFFFFSDGLSNSVLMKFNWNWDFHHKTLFMAQLSTLAVCWTLHTEWNAVDVFAPLNLHSV